MPKTTDGLKRWRKHYDYIKGSYPNLTGKQRMKMAKETFQKKGQRPPLPPKLRAPPIPPRPLKKNNMSTRKPRQLKPCKSGYSRNPTTNRCRKDCLLPKTRNPKTNRCRNPEGYKKPKPKPKPRVRKSTISDKERLRRQAVFEKTHNTLNPLGACRKGYSRSQVTRRCRKDCVAPKPVRNAKGRCVKK
jgi:hypothetical protein